MKQFISKQDLEERETSKDSMGPISETSKNHFLDSPDNSPLSLSHMELRENRIINQFKLKRKNIMNYIKQKQKLKRLNLVTVEKFQVKEGIVPKCHISVETQSLPELNKNTNYLEGQRLANQQNISQKKPSGHSKKYKKLFNVGVQTPKHMYKSRQLKTNATKQDDPGTHDKKQATEDILRIRKTENRIEVFKKKRFQKNEKDIEKIRAQMKQLFSINDNGIWIQTENPNSQSLTETESDSFESQNLNDHMIQIEKDMEIYNKRIEKFYERRYIKEVILDKYTKKVNKIRNCNVYKKNYQDREQKMLDKIKKRVLKNKTEKKRRDFDLSDIDQDSESFQQTFPKTKYIKKNNVKCLNYTRKPLNDRFKLALVQGQWQKSKQSQINEDNVDKNRSICNLIKREQKNSKTEELHRQGGFDANRAWIRENKEIMQIFSFNYPQFSDFLEITHIEGSKAKLEKRERMRIKQYCSNKTKKQIAKYQKLGSQAQKSQKKFPVRKLRQGKNLGTKNTAIRKQNQALKQLKFTVDEEEEFGKSFILKQLSSEDEQNQSIFYSDISSSQLQSHLKNLKKNKVDFFLWHDDCQNIEEEREFSVSSVDQNVSNYESSQVKKSKDSAQIETAIIQGNETRQKVEWSLFKSRDGVDYFDMSDG